MKNGKRTNRNQRGPEVHKVRVIYDEFETPYDVYSVAAFCQEWELDEQVIRDVLRGHTKEYQGWHINPEKTRRQEKRMAEVDAILKEWYRETGSPAGGARITQKGMDALRRTFGIAP